MLNGNGLTRVEFTKKKKKGEARIHLVGIRTGRGCEQKPEDVEAQTNVLVHEAKDQGVRSAWMAWRKIKVVFQKRSSKLAPAVKKRVPRFVFQKRNIVWVHGRRQGQSGEVG